MPRTPSNASARIVAFATATVTIAGVVLVGLAVAQGRGLDTRGSPIACALVGGSSAGSPAGRAPGC